MRHASNFVLRASLLLFLCLPAISQDQKAADSKTLPDSCQAEPTTKPQVLYTSRLFGYIRKDGDKEVQNYFDANMTCAKKKYPNALIVAMGDNLAPEYGSRFVNNKAKQRKGFTAPPDDNVADELVKQGYAVIAPGKEDFYFGVERFRFLAAKRYQFNAANLSETASYSVAQPDPNEPTRHPYVDDHFQFKPFDDGHLVLERCISPQSPSSKPPGQSPAGDQCPSEALPEMSLRHKATYSIEIDETITPTLSICDADHPDTCKPIGTGESPKLQPESSSKPDTASQLNSNLQSKSSANTDAQGAGSKQKFHVVTYDLSKLLPQDVPPSGSRKLLCFKGGLAKPETLSEGEWKNRYHERYCRPVSIDENFFQDFPYSAVPRKGRHPEDKPPTPAKYAVFVAVGSDIKNSLSQQNRSWGKNDDIKAELSVWDPGNALRQAYYECVFNDDCGKGTDIVVLAQTTKAAAQQLAGKLGDLTPKVIISKGEETSSYYGSDIDFGSAGDKVPVIGTRSIYIPGMDCDGNTSADLAALRNPLHLITVDAKSGKFSHIKTPVYPASQGDWCVSKDMKEQKPSLPDLANLVHQGQWKNQDLGTFVAEEMRKQFQGDVGMISSHEIFTGGLIFNPADLHRTKDRVLEEQTERTIWEGAHVVVLHLTGKKLRAVLDGEKQAPSTDKLSMSGVVANDNKDYYINGKPLADTAAYTVIAPDALVFGDPVYSGLSDTTFQEPQIRTESIARLVCNALKPRVPSERPEERQVCQTPDDIDINLADESLAARLPPSNLRPLGYLLSIFAPNQHNPLLLQSKSKASEDPRKEALEAQDQVQFRPLWFATLIKNNLNYALSKPNETDPNLAAKFAGVTDTNVVQAHTEKYGVDHDMRLGINWDHIATGIEEVIQFGRSRQGSTKPATSDSVTLSANTGTVGPFFEWAFAPNASPSLRLMLRPRNFSDNFARTFSTITGTTNPVTKLGTFDEDLPVRRNWSDRVGVRYEVPQRKDSFFSSDGNAFVEIGYKSTSNINVPVQLTLNPGTPGATTCSLDTVTQAGSLAACAKLVTVLTPTTLVSKFVSNRQDGFYWSFMFDFPVFKRLTYKVTSDGERRFSDDFSPERLYSINFDNYLQTRLIGNLSLAPHVGWFFYENQHDHSSLVRRIFDVTLGYTFDWHKGLGWRPFFNRPEVGH